MHPAGCTPHHRPFPVCWLFAADQGQPANLGRVLSTAPYVSSGSFSTELSRGSPIGPFRLAPRADVLNAAPSERTNLSPPSAEGCKTSSMLVLGNRAWEAWDGSILSSESSNNFSSSRSGNAARGVLHPLSRDGVHRTRCLRANVCGCIPDQVERKCVYGGNYRSGLRTLEGGRENAGGTHFQVINASDASSEHVVTSPGSMNTSVYGNAAHLQRTVLPRSPFRSNLVRMHISGSFEIPPGQHAPGGVFSAAEEIIRFVGNRG